MKKEDAVKRIRDKRTVLAIAVLLLIVAIILCVAAVRQNVGKKAPGMAELMTESLKESGFSYLPGGEYELEKPAEATAQL